MNDLLSVAVVLVALTLTVIAGGTFWWSLYAWRSPDMYEATRFAADPESTSLSFSLIVPCREELEEVVRATVGALLRQRHPDFEIILSVGDDDLPMIAIADQIAAEHDQVKVSVDASPVKNKPRQLNTALAMCTRDIVGIIDAESLTAPDLLRRVDATFAARKADVVQGAVQLMNYRSRWFTLRNCLEYRVWFRSRLHGHASAGFIPLGGNTVFLSRQLLDQVGGWDGDCLAEDCEIGVRLSARGKRIVVAYDADLTTKEEAPTTLKALIRQRTRWSLGFMQVLSKGDWRTLPTPRQRVGAWWTLVQQHAMAFSGLVLPLAILTALFADLPVLVSMIAFLPLIPTAGLVAFEVLILHDLGKDLKWDLGFRDYATLVISTPAYQFLLAISSLRAVAKYVSGDFRWEKTTHEGTHLPIAAGEAA